MVGNNIQIKLVLMAILFFSLISLANAEEISSWSDSVKIEQITNSYEIIGKDVDVETVIELFVSEEVKDRNDFIIRFDPWEPIYSPPIEKLSIEVCVGRVGSSNYNDISVSCEENISSYKIIENVDDVRNHYCIVNEKGDIVCSSGLEYKDYKIVFETNKISIPQRYAIKIHYTIKNKIMERGNYDIFKTFFGNMGDMKVKNYIVLPSAYSVPEKIFPTNTEFELEDVSFKPVFILDGTKEVYFWYTNTEEIEQKENKKQMFYLIIGAIVGAVFGWLISIINDTYKKEIQNLFKSIIKRINKCVR